MPRCFKCESDVADAVMTGNGMYCCPACLKQMGAQKPIWARLRIGAEVIALFALAVGGWFVYQKFEKDRLEDRKRQDEIARLDAQIAAANQLKDKPPAQKDDSLGELEEAAKRAADEASKCEAEIRELRKALDRERARALKDRRSPIKGPSTDPKSSPTSKGPAVDERIDAERKRLEEEARWLKRVEEAKKQRLEAEARIRSIMPELSRCNEKISACNNRINGAQRRIQQLNTQIQQMARRSGRKVEPNQASGVSVDVSYAHEIAKARSRRQAARQEISRMYDLLRGLRRDWSRMRVELKREQMKLEEAVKFLEAQGVLQPSAKGDAAKAPAAKP